MALCVYLVALFIGIAMATAGWTSATVVCAVIMAAMVLRYELLWLMKALRPYRAPRTAADLP